MAAIFAIIAIYSQGIFAIVAISFFAKFANDSIMKDLDLENRKWLAEKLANAPRGTKGEVAAAMGKTPDVVTRIINFSGSGEIRSLTKAPELHALAKYFGELPPSLRVPAKEAPDPPERAGGREIVRVPLLDRVTAGKLRQPLSQIPHGRDYLLLTDLGRGNFFALTVDGDSMDRLVPNGARIIVDESDKTLVTGKAYVISNRGEASLKLWKPNPPRFAPSSFNPTYEPIYVKSKDAAEKMVVGRVRRAIITFE